jgi:lysozyme
MTPAAWDAYLAELKNDEGMGQVRNGVCLPYQDPVGKWTIGWGHNLTDGGLKVKFAQLILEDDAIDHWTALIARFPIVQTLTDRRQQSLANATYNLGVAGIAEFHNMWTAIGSGDFVAASAALLDSIVARELPARYQRLAQDLKDG